MAAVPDKVLRWLYNVLGNEYHDPNRTYNDVAHTLAKIPSLQPRTEVYTYENGVSALLLQLGGTIPVQFRNNVYRFPILLWIPQAYPRQPPIVYVKPAAGMLVRPGQHVSGDGRVYHPYLANWGQYWDKSSTSDFLDMLTAVFAKEPPVISEQQAQAQARGPPTPGPSMAGSSSNTYLPQSMPPQRAASIGPMHGAPPRPPKPGEGSQAQNGYSHDRSGSIASATGPPLPPLPPPKQGEQSRYDRPAPLPPLQGGAGSSYGYDQRGQPVSSAGQPPQQQHYPASREQTPQALYNSQSPPAISQYVQRPHSQIYQQPSYTQPVQSQYQQQQQQQPGQQYAAPNQPQQHQQHSYQHQQQQTPQQYQAPPPAALIPKPLAINLLDSPLDVTLPSQNNPTTPLPVPIVPPNPQKDALLHALSTSLVSLTNTHLQNNTAAITPLLAQRTALQTAKIQLQNELSNLDLINQTIQANTSILQQTMSRADAVISSSRTQKLPPVDDLLVCQSVVGTQLYRLVAEVAACQEVRGSLGKGLDRGVIGCGDFVRGMRQMGREEFLKRVLCGKVARGMGLEDGRRG